ncbi:MAG: alpha/beta hydrolase [Brachybacterium tyrofermentans]|uniref:Alpha/beta hydrolase n=1 Tax=Brachybacterium tyrofermentans TaxID=47848 RepID=A0ABW0FH86_9MICO|nr:dienelactone hydrolase family protein [Brachybacterium tyrofermentans]SLM96208.1 possible phospholipase/carboxylesterase [Corynebacterium xerosis]
MSNAPQYAPVELICPAIDEDAVVRVDPQGSSPEGKPVVILLHGLGSHEEDLTGLVSFLPADFTYASLRGIYRYVQGYAWFEMPVDPAGPEAIQTSAAAVEAWIAGQASQGIRVAGAIGFSQGGALALQLLRRDPHALEWIVQLSGFPFPAPMPGDAALAEVAPPALWGHGGMDPHFDPEREEAVRAFMREHTRTEEESRPHLGHAVDEVELRAIAAFLQRRAADSPGC